MKISDYSFLSDCQSAALVSREGSVDWYCVPRFDSPSVFARILDADGGHWSIRPSAGNKQQRSYLPGTLVAETIFETGEGSVGVTDALVMAGGLRGHEIGMKVPHAMIRIVTGISGVVDMEMEFSPRFEYGLTRPEFIASERGIVAVGGPVRLELSASVPLRDTGVSAKAGFKVSAGETAEFGLIYTRAVGERGLDTPPINDWLEETVAAWRSWADMHQSYQGLYGEAVHRSALVLQGLTYQPSGSVVAAATTSLPEKIGGQANWDYRYAWLRDISLMMSALWIAACPDEPERFFEWISLTGVGREETVQIMFGVEGERDLSEHKLDNLDGYQGSKPIRIGNDAWKQKQLDVLGEVLDAAYLLRDNLGEMKDSTRDLLVLMADMAARRWQEPDAGMWEARDRLRHYTSSKVMCWVALDRAVKLADRLDPGEEKRRHWESARDEVRKAVMDKAWNEDIGAFAGAFDSDQLDASVLLMPIVGFLPAMDEKMRATIEVVSRELCGQGVVRRWSGEDNGFIMCSYWLVECLAMAGEFQRARELFERTSALGNDLGLFSEEADLETGELLGNFPQAFSHVGLINAAWRLTELEKAGAG
ncbi:MAG: glycoside hydrolase family 15 protein [Thermoleophilia bacterium]